MSDAFDDIADPADVARVATVVASDFRFAYFGKFAVRLLRLDQKLADGVPMSARRMGNVLGRRQDHRHGWIGSAAASLRVTIWRVSKSSYSLGLKIRGGEGHQPKANRTGHKSRVSALEEITHPGTARQKIAPA
jgi:hypothetical protein